MEVVFRLNHTSHMPGCVGMAGEEIEVSKEIAEKMMSRGGGEIVRSAIVTEPASGLESTPEPPAPEKPASGSKTEPEKTPEPPADNSPETVDEQESETKPALVSSLELDEAIVGHLEEAGYKTVESLQQYVDDGKDLTEITNIGKVSAGKIMKALGK